MFIVPLFFPEKKRILDGLQRVVQFVRDGSKQVPYKRQPFTLDQL